MRAMTLTAVLLTLLTSLSTTSRSAHSSTTGSTSEPLTNFSDTSVANLSMRGPSIPASFDSNNFGMFYIVRGNWPVVLRYELPEGTARFRITLQRGGPFDFELTATGREVRKVSLRLPSQIGDVPQIAQLRLTVRGPANLVLHSLGCGRRALASPVEGPRRPGAADEYLHNFRFVNANQQGSGGTDEVAIAGIILSPHDTLNASQGAQLSFSFKSTNDFPMWSATFQRQVRESGSRWQVEKVVPFGNDPIHQGQTKQNSWNGKNGQGLVVAGRYKLMVSAWTSAALDGSAVTSFSSPAFTVR